MRILYSALFIICLGLSSLYAIGTEQPTDALQTFRFMAKGGQNDEAFRILKTQFNSEKNPDTKSKMAMGLGILSYKVSNFPASIEYFNQALQLKTRLDDYAQYYLGLIERENKNWIGAKKHFEAVRNHVPSSVREADAEVELERIAKIQDKKAEAFNILVHLERRHRTDPQYADILYDLTEVSLARKQRAEACRASLKLYSKLPGYTIVKGWGLALNKVKVGGILLPCWAGVREKEKRFHNLLLAGEFDEVRTELKDWVAEMRVDMKAHPDEMGRQELIQGQLSQAEGHIKEAIAHYLTAQDMMGRNVNAQMLLSRAYAQTDDYTAAIEGYLRAFQLAPRSNQGAKALFQAAFLSYQNRDYDGAARQFEILTKRGRGSIVWDARWHLAWIRYLKSDYDGALRSFTELAGNRHYAKSVDLEKLQYWRGMSYYRLGAIEQARSVFSQLAVAKRLGYYTGAAQARLVSLPMPAANSVTVASSPAPSPSPHPTPGLPPLTPTPPVSSGLEASNRVPASDDESLTGAKDPDKADEEADDEDESKGATESPPETVSVTPLKNQVFAARFERARDLIDLGFDAWAQLELREIEKRTSNRGYLQALMAEYLKAGDFYRSAFIADVIFSYQREKAGLEGANAFWSCAFPQAYSRVVTSSCKKFDVSPSLAWSIMRGESGFREDIHSSAGALGLMQLIPSTAKRIAKGMGYPDFRNSMLMSPETNILFGVWYLKRLNKTMSNNIPLTVASYNAGPHRVQGWMKDFGNLEMDEFVEHIPYMETRNYVKKVLRNYFIYQSLYEKKVNPLSWLAQKPSIKYLGPKPIAENWDE